MERVYKVSWREYERGCGSKHSHNSYYEDEISADIAIKKYWDGMPDRDKLGRAPDYYLSPTKIGYVAVRDFFEITFDVEDVGTGLKITLLAHDEEHAISKHKSLFNPKYSKITVVGRVLK